MTNFNEINKNTYNSISENWDTKRQYYWEPVINFLDKIENKNNLKILDIGCGGGRHMQLALEKGFSKENIYGCDFSKKQIETIIKKGFEGKVCDLRDLKFKNNSFDIIICIAAFHHLFTKEDWIKALNEMKRIMKKDSKILLSNWFPEKEFLKKQIEKNKFKYINNNNKIVKVKFTDISQNKTYNRYYYLFDENELKSICLETKFNIEKKEYHKGNLYLTLN